MARAVKAVYDICQKKVISGKDRPCYEKLGALCRKNEDWWDCWDCRYWPHEKRQQFEHHPK